MYVTSFATTIIICKHWFQHENLSKKLLPFHSGLTNEIIQDVSLSPRMSVQNNCRTKQSYMQRAWRGPFCANDCSCHIHWSSAASMRTLKCALHQQRRGLSSSRQDTLTGEKERGNVSLRSDLVRPERWKQPARYWSARIEPCPVSSRALACLHHSNTWGTSVRVISSD